MRATRDSGNDRGHEKTDRPEWAGLPIEYWIDLEVLEESPLFEILEDLCHRFPQRSRQQHIELIAARLTARGRKDEIGFYLVSGERNTDLTISDALAQLRLLGTWDVNWDKHMVVWQKPPGVEKWGRRLGLTGPALLEALVKTCWEARSLNDLFSSNAVLMFP